MRASLLAGILVGALVAPALPVAASPPTFYDVIEALTLHAYGVGNSLVWLAAAPESGLDMGETILLDETLRDPLALLELPEIPEEFLGLLTVRRLGSVVGARVTEVPDETLLAASALADRPVHADRLRSYMTQASVRNAAGGLYQDDLGPLLAGAHG